MSSLDGILQMQTSVKYIIIDVISLSNIYICKISFSVELHIISNDGAASMNWLNEDDNTVLSTSDNGYSVISYCVQCDNELSGSSDDDLTGCGFVKTQVPTDCCPLSKATSRDGTALCGTGWTYDTCETSSAAMNTELSKDVVLSTNPDYTIRRDGHSFEVRLPFGKQNQLKTDTVDVVIKNDSDHWRKVKINFHIEKPNRITGISAVLRDPDTHEPTGIHVQMSKNWHENRPGLYDSYWWTGVAHVRVPPGETELQLAVDFQYYKGLHAVSHSQLCLVGWGVNGLWEEVGLGSNGESITYEPHGHHRRQMILDTRPWLVCALGQSGCGGSPDSTQWTENVGGGDFLNAVDKTGMYQYLVGDTSFHTMNGPRLTNATYVGVTVDQNIEVSRTTSTGTAGEFFL